MPRIALVTAGAARDLDTDLAPLSEALAQTGAASATVACWDDQGFPWPEVDAAVLRSAWDYPQRIGSFLTWVESTAGYTHLLNTPETIRWNADKRYLANLGTDGVPVVPTTFVEPDDRLVLPDGEIVVKPAISAGSKDTARFGPGDPAADRFARRILDEGRTVMVQPYQSAVDTSGETALVWFDGIFSHAFRKGAILSRGESPTDQLYAEEDIEATDPTEREIEVAALAIGAAADAVGDVPLYARVDLVPGPDGSPLLLELELIEPSVYHHVDPESAGRFADAILARVG
jgi:O-ureido-D-serine cyclo-ligase